MDDLLVGLGVIDRLSGGRGMRAIYERIGDEPRRPVRRRLATALRILATWLAPGLPEAPDETRAAPAHAAP